MSQEVLYSASKRFAKKNIQEGTYIFRSNNSQGINTSIIINALSYVKFASNFIVGILLEQLCFRTPLAHYWFGILKNWICEKVIIFRGVGHVRCIVLRKYSTLRLRWLSGFWMHLQYCLKIELVSIVSLKYRAELDSTVNRNWSIKNNMYFKVF